MRENTYIKPTPSDVIFGIRSVIEAIRSGREINKIMILKGMKKELFYELKEELANKDYFLQFVPVEKLNRITAENHQGVIAYVSPVDYLDVEEFLDARVLEGKTTSILVLDRITDVRNFGAIARTAECQGIDAILIPSKGSAQVTADAVKTSAGALNRMPICRTSDLKNSLFYLQQSGLRLIACTEKGNVPLYEANFRGNVAIIFGSEEDGITSDLLNMSDIKARIPMRGEIARTAECQGIDAILIPSKGSAQVTADAVKTSAGALNRMPICRTSDLKNSLFYLQQSGLRLIACTEKGNVPLYEANFRGNVAIIFGSEEDGITSDLLNMSDIKARIPMRGEIASLNVGVSVGMALYEKTRQELYG